MRIGILQCDSVREDLQPDFGDYPDMFQCLLRRQDPGLEFRVHDLTRGESPESLDACDAWLFTGSKWSVYDDEDWIGHAHELAQRLHATQRPTIGICFGHQLIARALGGRVEKAPAGWGVGVHTARVLARREWMQPERRSLSLVVSHQDQVMALPPGADLLAGHEFCPHDILQIGEHTLTFQGHPEFPKAYSRATMEQRRGLVGEDAYREGIASLAAPIEEDVAATWILRFLERAGARAG